MPRDMVGDKLEETTSRKLSVCQPGGTTAGTAGFMQEREKGLR